MTVSNETAIIKSIIAPYCEIFGNKGIDIGCGCEKIRDDAIGVEFNSYGDSNQINALPGENVAGVDASKRLPFDDESMDYAYASHVLEDFYQPHKALREWWRVIRKGGGLIVVLPHADYYPEAGSEGANKAHLRDWREIEFLFELMKAHIDYRLLDVWTPSKFELHGVKTWSVAFILIKPG